MKTINYHDYEIRVEPDSNPQDPRIDMDNLFTFIGDSESIGNPDAHLNPYFDFTGNLMVDIANFFGNDYEETETKKASNWVKKNLICFKVYMTNHSGYFFDLARGDKWDSGLFGALCVKKADALEECSAKRVTKKVIERLEKIARGELETYEAYVNGYIKSVSLYRNENEVDSVHGVFDESVEYEIGEMKAIADSNLEKRNAASLAILKEMLAKKEPLEKIRDAVVQAFNEEPKQVYYTYSQDAGGYVAVEK